MGERLKFIIFGSTGDLARRKLFPALKRLRQRYDMDVIAIGRRFSGREEFRKEMGMDAEYIRADITRDNVGIEGSGKAIFYLALSPELYPHAVRHIAAMDFGEKKVAIEKPFGYDYSSALKYHEMLAGVFDESEIYHIDHYLGKEFIQNLLVLRFNNDLLRGIWNARFIDHIQIIVDEDSGIEKRLGFYNRVGAIRDMLQNHIMQIISLLLIPEPVETSQKALAYEKIRVMKSLEVRDVVRAKYMKELERESFVAVKLESSLFDFKGMPIYVRTGKRMGKRKALIYIQFRGLSGNSLVIEIQPEMRMEFVMNIRSFDGFRKARMVYNHTRTIGMNTPDAYEYLLERIILGERTFFPAIEEILEAWKVVERIEERAGDVVEAEGLPEEAMEMIERDGRQWVV